MKYKPSQYAESLYEALKDKKPVEQKAVLKNFYLVLQKNGDAHLRNMVVKKYEKIYLKKNNMRKVEVESASVLSPETKREIEETVGSKVLFTEKVKPELLAGLTILLDDSVFIDASGKTKINNLFR